MQNLSINVWLVLLAALALVVTSCRATNTPLQTIPKPSIRPLTNIKFEPNAARLERGQYLTEGVLQCFVCHTDRDWAKPGAPPIEDMKGSGYIWTDTPGLVAPNITPDKETGAGNWTDDMFSRAIREGISHDGRPLDLQMFSLSYRFLSDEDVASVVVYLRSLKPIHNPLPQTKLDKYPDPATPLTAPVAEPDLSTPAARGRYLIRIGTCIGCHTAFFNTMSPGYFGGGDPVKRGKELAFSANLTSDPSGILSYYDESLFLQTLRTGKVKARKLSPVMPWIAVGKMTDDDLKSIFAYLKTRRPVQHVVDNTEPPTFCPKCGQMHGYGDRNVEKDLSFHSFLDDTAGAGFNSGSGGSGSRMKEFSLRDLGIAGLDPGSSLGTRDPANFDSYVGSYRTTDDWLFTISRDGDRLLLQSGVNGPIYQLSAISETEFTCKEIPEVLSFVKNARGEVTHLLYNVDDLAPRISV